VHSWEGGLLFISLFSDSPTGPRLHCLLEDIIVRCLLRTLGPTAACRAGLHFWAWFCSLPDHTCISSVLWAWDGTCSMIREKEQAAWPAYHLVLSMG